MQNLADNLAEKAFNLSFDEDYLSPFAKKSKKGKLFGFGGFNGGKPDDITVVAAQMKIMEEK